MDLRHVKLDFKPKRPEPKSGACLQAEYRERLKSDPLQWQLYQNKQKQYMKNHWNNLTDEERKVKREERKIKQRERRQKAREAEEKQKTTPSSTSKNTSRTVKTRKNVQDSRTYWRERKREQRAQMTPQEKMEVKARENERRRAKRRNKNQQVHFTLGASTLFSPSVSSTPVPDLSSATTAHLCAQSPQSTSVPPHIDEPAVAPPSHSPPHCSASATPLTANETVPPSHIIASIDSPSCPSITPSPTTIMPPPCSPSASAKYCALHRVKQSLPSSKQLREYVINELLQSCSPSTKKRIFENTNSSPSISSPEQLPTDLPMTRQTKDSLTKEQAEMDSKETSNDSQCFSSSSGSPLPRDSQKASFREGLEPRTDETARQELKKLSLDEHGTFMMDFDPEKSQRELRKMNRRIHGKGSNKNALYDERGIFLDIPMDLCDCLSKNCPGCHFPCPKCGSDKCGTDCRCGRRYNIDLIEIEGTDTYYSFPL